MVISMQNLWYAKNADDTYTVVEGNRRLAACLIITGDDRASHQA